MHATIQDFETMHFWIAVVAVGLVIHIVGHYLWLLFDKSLGSSRSFLQGLTKRSRDKREARARQISEWIDTHDNGAVLALMEAHYLSIVGYVLVIMALIGLAAALAEHSDQWPISRQLAYALLILFVAIGGMTLFSMGAQIRTVVNGHPQGVSWPSPAKIVYISVLNGVLHINFIRGE